MVRSRLASVKHLLIALAALGLCVCTTELALHLQDACVLSGCGNTRSACAPSWTVHHLFKPDVHIVTSDPDTEAEVEWRTNSHGLRGAEIEVPKPAGTFRIICLGDDSTLAPETPTAATFCQWLQQSLQPSSPLKIEVINAGCPQYGPLLSYLLLKHSLLSLAPDLVICNFDMADVANDYHCRRYVRMSGMQPLYCPHPDLEWQRSAAERIWVERLLMWRHGQRGLGYVLGKEDQPEDVRDIDSLKGTYAWLRDDAPDWSLYIDQTLSVIGQMSALCQRSHCSFALSVVPCPWQTSAEASSGAGVRPRVGVQEHTLYASRTSHDILAAFANKEAIALCDSSKVFERVERPERLFLRNAARFSAAGHELYARVVGGFLLRNIAGPWSSGGSSGARPGGRLSAGGSGHPASRPDERVEPAGRQASAQVGGVGRTGAGERSEPLPETKRPPQEPSGPIGDRAAQTGWDESR